jgi:UDPglucose--hexose-1-phosphate uridylyltransferase
LIALPAIPKRVKEEVEGAKSYYDFKERCIYCDIIRQEVTAGLRVVLETDRFLAISPYAPRFPFETWIIPKQHESHFENLDTSAVPNLAWTLRSILRKLDKSLEKPAYNFILHTAPVQETALAHYHWHIEIIPRLTKLAGFEWGTGFHINPTPPEESAKFLREAGLG